jgi:pyruvate/2-oxoglutarate dehydrogenase complex dihydrolipoamide acyltransferase (E2) component
VPASVVVQAREVDLGFPVEATVEAVRQATVAAQIAGRVLDIRVDAGQRVKQGELLMRIDAREAAGSDASAQATLAQAAPPMSAPKICTRRNSSARPRSTRPRRRGRPPRGRQPRRRRGSRTAT